MTRLPGCKMISEDFALPDQEDYYGSGTNVITSTSFANLPTTTCAVSITNPHSTADMLVIVTWGAWLSASANNVRACPALSGATTLSAGVSAAGPVNWGEIASSGSSNARQHMGMSTYELSPGTTTFTLQGLRASASGTQQINYPMLRVQPIRFLI